jgi:hypothetical protein
MRAPAGVGQAWKVGLIIVLLIRFVIKMTNVLAVAVIDFGRNPLSGVQKEFCLLTPAGVSEAWVYVAPKTVFSRSSHPECPGSPLQKLDFADRFDTLEAILPGQY